jgi:hypothetical protein
MNVRVHRRECVYVCVCVYVFVHVRECVCMCACVCVSVSVDCNCSGGDLGSVLSCALTRQSLGLGVRS